MFEKFIKENDGRIFYATEFVGNNEPEKMELMDNSASQNIKISSDGITRRSFISC